MDDGRIMESDGSVWEILMSDRNGHIWLDRGTGVCPHICALCGALSGTDKAITLCEVGL